MKTETLNWFIYPNNKTMILFLAQLFDLFIKKLKNQFLEQLEHVMKFVFTRCVRNPHVIYIKP